MCVYNSTTPETHTSYLCRRLLVYRTHTPPPFKHSPMPPAEPVGGSLGRHDAKEWRKRHIIYIYIWPVRARRHVLRHITPTTTTTTSTRTTYHTNQQHNPTWKEKKRKKNSMQTTNAAKDAVVGKESIRAPVPPQRYRIDFYSQGERTNGATRHRLGCVLVRVSCVCFVYGLCAAHTRYWPIVVLVTMAGGHLRLVRVQGLSYCCVFQTSRGFRRCWRSINITQCEFPPLSRIVDCTQLNKTPGVWKTRTMRTIDKL